MTNERMKKWEKFFNEIEYMKPEDLAKAALSMIETSPLNLMPHVNIKVNQPESINKEPKCPEMKRYIWVRHPETKEYLLVDTETNTFVLA